MPGLTTSRPLSPCSLSIMKKTTVIPGNLLPRQAVDIGHLVLNPKDPGSDFFNPAITSSENEPPIVADDILVQHQYNFSHLLSTASGTGLHLVLTALLGLDRSNESENKTKIDSIRRTTYALANNGEVFKKICHLDAAKRYLERAYSRRKNVYLVVGLETLLDANLHQYNSSSKGSGGEVIAPGALITTAATGIPIPLGDVLDVGVGIKGTKKKEMLTSYFAEGEHIFAVQYRKIEFRWFSGGNVAEEANLKDCAVWKSFWMRSAGTGDEGEADELAVSATLDVEREHLKPNAEIFEDEEEIILY